MIITYQEHSQLFNVQKTYSQKFKMKTEKVMGKTLSGFSNTFHDEKFFSPPFREIFFSVFFFFTWHLRITGKQGEGKANSNSSLPIPPPSRILRHQPDNYCRDHLCSKPATRLEPRRFGFSALVDNQPSNHEIKYPRNLKLFGSWKCKQTFKFYCYQSRLGHCNLVPDSFLILGNWNMCENISAKTFLTKGALYLHQNSLLHFCCKPVQ